jgi:hypothetical protein
VDLSANISQKGARRLTASRYLQFNAEFAMKQSRDKRTLAAPVTSLHKLTQDWTSHWDNTELE